MFCLEIVGLKKDHEGQNLIGEGLWIVLSITKENCSRTDQPFGAALSDSAPGQPRTPDWQACFGSKAWLSERVLRAQVDFLKGCGLLVFSSSGMTVTEEGMDILRELADYVRKLQGLNSLEQLLCSKLNIGRVYYHSRRFRSGRSC